MKQYPQGSFGHFWQRFGATVVLVSLLAVFIGIMVYAMRSEDIERGNDRPMGVSRQ